MNDFFEEVDVFVAESARAEDRPIAGLLQEYDLKVASVGSSEELAGRIDQAPHAVLVADLQARGLDGFALVEKVRRRKLHTPVIVVTDASGQGVLEAALELNVAHFVPRPVDPGRLMAEVTKCADYLYERRERALAVAEEKVVGDLLQLALRPSSLTDFLQAALERVMEGISWLKALPQGGVFLVRKTEGEPHLALVAAHGLSPRIRTLCRTVPFGHCLCGRAARSRAIQFADCVDERHEVRFDGMAPHGHYNVPLLHDDRLLGVMVFYLPPGHPPLPRERAFLKRLAGTLSMGIHGRMQSLALEEAERRAQEMVGQMEGINRNLSGILFRRIDHADGRVEYPYVSASQENAAYFPSQALREGLFDGTELIHPADREAVRAAMAQGARTLTPLAIDFRLQLEDGGTRWMHCSSYPSRLEDGSVCWDGLLLDIEERKALESQLLQAQKLEAVGQLAAGIAHEINTPTQYVSDNTHFLGEAFEDLADLIQTYRESLRRCGAETALAPAREKEEEIDLDYLLEEIPQALEQAAEGLDKIGTIVRAMKEFSHPGSDEKEAIDLNRMLENTVTISRNEWKYVAEMELELEEGLPPVTGHAHQLGQVFLNIIVNAAHAIAGIGGEKVEREGRIHIHTLREGDQVEIHIRDNGPGIPAEVKKRIFDPFFTTKEVGKGTGQGLSIAHDIVCGKHGGSLRVEDAEPHGTRFVIRLPLSEE